MSPNIISERHVAVEEITKDFRECGLIAEKDMPNFEISPPEENMLHMFDSLCENADCGWVAIENKRLLLDHRLENNNEIRSIIEIIEHDDGWAMLETSSLIQHRNGNFYVEVHPSRVSPSGELIEPEVGSSEVTPASHTAAVVNYYKIALDATPLRQVA